MLRGMCYTRVFLLLLRDVIRSRSAKLALRAQTLLRDFTFAQRVATENLRYRNLYRAARAYHRHFLSILRDVIVRVALVYIM